MISDNIKNQRTKKGLTQKDLADRLHVTPQAISRWEKGDVEPSLGTVKDMAEIFEISVDELLNDETTQLHAEKIEDIVKQVAEETAKQVKIPEQKPVLTICEKCKQPIYDSDKIVTKTISNGETSYLCHLCLDCDEKERTRIKEKARKYGKSRRVRSFLWGGILGALVVFLGLLYSLTLSDNKGTNIIITIILSILGFTFISCLLLKNNFVGEIFCEVAGWGIVNFPELIFSFDLTGIAWLIVMKILFGILGFLIGFAATLLALAICMVLSLFFYPFALNKNIKHPERTEGFNAN